MATSVVLRDGINTLNLSAQKPKQVDSKSQENIFERVASRIAKSLEKSTNILASTFCSIGFDLSSSSTVSALATLALSSILSNDNTLSISNLNTRMIIMESKLGNVKSILNRILATVSGKTINRNENTNIGKRNITEWELYDSVEQADFL